ncbi:hypothetical protein ACA910_006579 [Epithemia clementina (nom. ined.)]
MDGKVPLRGPLPSKIGNVRPKIQVRVGRVGNSRWLGGQKFVQNGHTGGNIDKESHEDKNPMLKQEELKTLNAELFKTPAGHNKRRCAHFAVDKVKEEWEASKRAVLGKGKFEALLLVPNDKEEAIKLFEANLSSLQCLSFPLNVGLSQISGAIMETAQLASTVDKDLHNTLDNILNHIKKLRMEMGKSAKAILEVQHQAPTIWGVLSTLLASVTALEFAVSDSSQSSQYARQTALCSLEIQVATLEAGAAEVKQGTQLFVKHF